MKRTSRRLGVVLLWSLWACGGDSSQSGGVRGEDAGPEDAGAGDSGKPEVAPARRDAAPADAAESGEEPSCEARCQAPARCSEEDGAPRCVCPEGYEDSEGDGSKCEDVDECDEPGRCGAHATCKNREGGFDCTCDAPAYRGDGRSCECADGYSRDAEGFCVGADGQACSDNLDCEHRHCEGGTCCAQRCLEPGKCRSEEGATCRDGKTCEYPKSKDGASCDDDKACTAASSCVDGACVSGDQPTDCDDENPCTDDSCEEPAGCKNRNNSAACDDRDACTADDRCATGSCQGGPRKDCSSAADSCNNGACDPSDGKCVPQPLPGSAACDDANSCTTEDRCSAGVCAGSGNACGINADSCSPGAPNACGCKPMFVAENGLCLPAEDECKSANPCAATADCFDPSNTAGDVTCTCKAGYTGNGTSCSPLDPCRDNPCGEGRGSCTAANGGSYTCSCGPGYVAVAGQCVCDMAGTFAARTRLDLAWSNLSDQIEDGSDTTYSYSLERHSYDANGLLTLEVIACGTTSLDACGLGAAPVLGAEAYSQFLPSEIWNTPSMPVLRTSLSLPNALPGSPFETAEEAALQGITLSDPKGAWPSSYTQVVGTPDYAGTAVNGATFIDHDDDTYVGLTSYAVPPGGVSADGVAPDPIWNFGANSAACPRLNDGPRTPYAYWPAPPQGLSLTPVRVKRFYTASRVISALKGKLDSCDQLSGEVVGPDGGKARVDARVGGCVRSNGSGEAACPSNVIAFLDGGAQNQQIVSATFKVKRLSDPNATCAAVRAVDFE
jgi:hypothetical protein